MKICEYKNVTGKCEVCEACKKLMTQSKSKALRIIVRQYKLMHRAFFMGEKLMYYQRRAEAANSDGEIGSIIIDKMGTHVTQLPLLSNLYSLKEHFPVAVTGAISHGTNETTFYLSAPNVSIGASYTIHCIFAEMRKLYARNKNKPLKKVFIEIDGASDNTAEAIIAACEHLVFKEFCPYILVARLPVGHTHEDIDSRFGKIWTFVRDRHVYSFDGFCTIIKEAFGNSDRITVQPIYAILDYKTFYDQFIDDKLVDKYSRMEFTQLYFKIQPVRASDYLGGSSTPNSNLIVRTNYRKFGQEYTVFLRESNGQEGDYNNSSSSEVPYVPTLIKSAWIPENAKDAPCIFPQTCNSSCPCKERAPGIRFLKSAPTSRPHPMQFEKGWFKSFSAFIDKVNIVFRKRKEEQYAEYWQKFASMCMPISEQVADFILQHDIDSPLGQILYFPTRKFAACQEHFQSLVTVESTSITGFSNTSTRIRASPFDLDLMKHIEQNKQTVPWRGHRQTYKNWEFNKPQLLQRILLTRGTGDTKRIQKGTCVAYCEQDINEGNLFLNNKLINFLY